MLSIMLVSALGFILSFYAFLLKRKLKSNPEYKPVCDISDFISCSKPVLSEYGKIFIIANSVVGMLFYALMFGLAIKGMAIVLFGLSIAVCLASGYLAYILFFKIHTWCLLCTAMYIVNVLLLLLSYQNL